VQVPAADLRLGYRRSSLRDEQVVVSADLRLTRGDVAEGEARLADIVRWRREHQPGGQNAGSVFTNPPGESAGRLIELAGGKGLRVGTAAVSTKHANFVQADPGGSADDVFELMVRVARLVRDRTGVRLHPETRLVALPDFDEAVGA
jgi:UDP-N-acetylmuramate dehydrogenase